MSNSSSNPCDDPIEWSCSSKIVPAILVSLGAGLATAVGGALVFCPLLLKKVPQKVVLAVSLALSAGVMLYVSFIEIFSKSLDEISNTDGITEGSAAAITTACFFAGMLFCVLLEVLVHFCTKRSGGTEGHVCAAHSTAMHDHDHAQPPDVKVNVVGNAETANDFSDPTERVALKSMGLMTAAAIAIHNFPEGLATFLTTLSDTKVGASLGVAVAIHNIPEGLCVAMPIYYATGSMRKGFLWAFLSGLTEPIGGILGFAVLQPVFTSLVFGIVFSMVGGMMIFIVCHELLPAAHRYMGNSNYATAWLLVGMFIMAVSLVLFADFDTPSKVEER